LGLKKKTELIGGLSMFVWYLFEVFFFMKIR